MNWILERLLHYPERIFFNGISYGECFELVKKRMEYNRKLYHDTKRINMIGKNEQENIIELLSLLALNKEVMIYNPDSYNGGKSNETNTLSESAITNVEEFEDSDQDDDIAIILLTSGSTDNPKQVPITWKMIKSHVVSSQGALNVTPDDCWLLVLPIFHIGGLMILFRSLYNGTSFVLLDKFRTTDIVEMINEKRINMLSLVPTMLKRILPQVNKHSLRVLLLGGESISDHLVELCLEKKIPLFKTYGMTETCSQVCTLNISAEFSKRKTVGKPISGFEIQIADKDSEGVGEITIKGPTVFTSYLGEKKKLESYATGDLGKLDEEGYLTVVGRVDDMVISGGENIYPAEIEHILKTHPDIKDCAVIGCKDETWGNILIAIIEGENLEYSYKNYLLEVLPGYKIPKKWIFLDRLPLGNSGKVDRKILKKRLCCEN